MQLGVGLGLRSQHYFEIIETKPNLSWFEAISENYMGITGGEAASPLRTLERIRRDYPVVLHGVSMSIGSTDPLDFGYLDRLGALIDRVEPKWVSDHLCWTGVQGENLHDLLPLPYTDEALDHLVPRILRVQDRLKQRLTIENVSSYLSYAHSTMSEWEFLTALSERADCNLLLDINNVYVSAINHRFDPLEFVRGVPVGRVIQMHLAGHSKQGDLLIDTHNQPVIGPVWDLYRQAVKIFGATPTLIEWDADIPSFGRLLEEVRKAEAISREVLSD